MIFQESLNALRVTYTTINNNRPLPKDIKAKYDQRAVPGRVIDTKLQVAVE
jgi:hypothetical protein